MIECNNNTVYANRLMYFYYANFIYESVGVSDISYTAD